MQRASRIYKSPQNISVYQNWKYRWVLFDKRYIQSMIYRRNPSKLILPYMKTFLCFTDINPGEICLMGLGGGTSLNYLLKQKKHHYITVIEKYSEMIHIAKHYFYLPKDHNYQILCLAAEDFVQDSHQEFEHMLIDLGDINGYPPACQSTEFFQACHRLLKPQAILAINLTHESLIADFKSILHQVFGHPALCVYAHGNWILFISPKLKSSDLIEQLKTAHLIKRYIWEEKIGEMVFLNNQIQRTWQRIRSVFFKKNTAIRT